MTRDYYTPAEVARKFAVDPKTVVRWTKAGRLSYTRTLGGHRRFSRAEVDAAMTRSTVQRRG